MKQRLNKAGPARQTRRWIRLTTRRLKPVIGALLLALLMPALQRPIAAQENSWCAQAADLDISQEECLALETLYRTAGGSISWRENDGWLDSAAVCDEWYGIACDEAGSHVTEIVLESNNLLGSVPASLGNLSALQVLDLSSNRLSGPIPAELGLLQQLQDLSLGANELEGPIPPALGGLANLQNLDLGANRLSGSIPATLAQLDNLSLFFYLDGNRLEGEVPLEICSMPNTFLSASLDFNKLNIYDTPQECDQKFENWYRTQTSPPSGFAVAGDPAAPGAPARVRATWNAVPSATSAGSYELFTRDRFSGEVVSRGETSDLGESELIVTINDDPERYAYFMRSNRAPHAGNASALSSDDSFELRLNSAEERRGGTAELQRLLYLLALALAALFVLALVLNYIVRKTRAKT